MQKQEFEERIEKTVTDEQYKVIEEVYMWHPSIRNTSGKVSRGRRVYPDRGDTVNGQQGTPY